MKKEIGLRRIMKKQGIGAIILSGCLILTGCNGGIKEQDTAEKKIEKENQQEMKEEQYSEDMPLQNLTIMDYFIEGKEAVLIYMVGSNLESEAGLATEDIKEILKNDFSEDNLSIYLCTGGAKKWWMEGMSSDVCQVYQIIDGKQESIATLKGKNMGESDTLTEFVNLVYEKTCDDTDYYSMIMWNHGGGTILGFGADENYQYDTLTMVEMNQGMKNTRLIQEGRKLEWIGFDACLMGMLEVAELFSEYANYLIASEEIEGEHGWEYSVLSTISKKGHLDGLQAGKDFVDSYEHYCLTMGAAAPDYTMSCMDLSKVNDTISSLEELIQVAGEEIRNDGYSKIARRRDNSKTFGKISNQDFYDIVDLYDLSLQLADLYPGYVQSLWRELDDFIVYTQSNVPQANGVAIYFPYANKEYAPQWMEEYGNIGFSERYVEFLIEFTNILTSKELVEWKIADIIPEEEEQEEGTYFVQLTEEQCANFGHAKYGIWEQDEDSFICWLQSSEVTLLEDGKLQGTFEKKKFYLQDEKGNRYDCTAVETERTEDYGKYVIPITVWEAENLGMKICWIHVRMSQDKKNVSVIGIYNQMNADSMMLPDKNTAKIQNGDSVYPFLFARNPVYQKDGSLAPFEQWESSSGFGEGFSYQGTLDIVYDDMDIKENTCCFFSITDTQSNGYFTNPFFIKKK